MKKLAIIFIAINFFSAAITYAQSQNYPQLESELRRLDAEAARAIKDKDEIAIARFFSNESVTNNPRSGLTRGSAGVINAAKTGVIDYFAFERNIESVQILGKTAILMGNEKVVLRSREGGPGETILRRYTNVWMKSGRTWQIVARHANIICS